MKSNIPKEVSEALARLRDGIEHVRSTKIINDSFADVLWACPMLYTGGEIRLSDIITLVNYLNNRSIEK